MKFQDHEGRLWRLEFTPQDVATLLVHQDVDLYDAGLLPRLASEVGIAGRIFSVVLYDQAARRGVVLRELFNDEGNVTRAVQALAIAIGKFQKQAKVKGTVSVGS